jgi:hypothetical protein
LLALANASDANAQAAAPAAEKLKISVGGFMSQYVGWVETDRDRSENPTSDEKHFDQKSDSEIYFTGSVNLDNGMTASVVVQLEIDGSTSSSHVNTGSTGTVATTQMIDESYLRLSSATLGELRLGFQDPAAQTISVAAPWVGLNPYNQDTTVWLARPSASSAATATGMSTTAGGGDDNRINYISPSIFGIRAAVGYTPSTADTEDQPLVNEQDLFHTAIQWAGKFGDVGARAYGGYWRTNGLSAINATTQTTTSGGLNNYSLGADVTFADFTVGAGAMFQDQIRCASTSDGDQWVWNLGVKYAPGPFSVGLLYMRAEHDATLADPDEDEAQRIQLGATYLLGPGVNLIGNILWHDYTDETPSTSGAANNSPTRWAVITGIQVDF